MSNNLKDLFPDWEELEPGTWSEHGMFIQYGKDKRDFIEIRLYREPKDDSEYSATYTLQGFDGDDVIFCHGPLNMEV